MKKLLMTFVILLLAATFVHAGLNRHPGYKVKSKHTDRGIQIANQLLKMRKDLTNKYIGSKARAAEEEVDKVCLAVAEKAKKIVGENNIFIVRFASEKFRNPGNAATEKEMTGLQKLDKNRKKKEDWGAVRINDEAFYLYMKPIFVEKACLDCHGEAKKIPKIIKQKYPDDRSYGFSIGDLMGAVAVYTWKGW